MSERRRSECDYDSVACGVCGCKGSFGQLVWGRSRGYNLLDCFSGAVQINDPLVDPHLKAVPGLGALPTGCLACGYAESLGWHANGSLHTEVLVLGTAYQVLAHWMR